MNTMKVRLTKPDTIWNKQAKHAWAIKNATRIRSFMIAAEVVEYRTGYSVDVDIRDDITEYQIFITEILRFAGYGCKVEVIAVPHP
jgi:hypothetical protein